MSNICLGNPRHYSCKINDTFGIAHKSQSKSTTIQRARYEKKQPLFPTVLWGLIKLGTTTIPIILLLPTCLFHFYPARMVCDCGKFKYIEIPSSVCCNVVGPASWGILLVSFLASSRWNGGVRSEKERKKVAEMGTLKKETTTMTRKDPIGNRPSSGISRMTTPLFDSPQYSLFYFKAE